MTAPDRIASAPARTAPATDATLAEPTNTERVLVSVLRDEAGARGIDCTLLGEGWILRLTRRSDGLRRHVHGYSFDLNPAATHQICCDKAATSEVLSSAGLACVPHALVLHPDMARFVPHRGTWEQVLARWRAWGSDAVVKENEGTGGRGVARCRTIVELERAVYTLFEGTQAIALSPYVEIDHEYRFVMLDGRCEVLYEKVRASVVGDGRCNVLELIAQQRATTPRALAALLANLSEDERSGLAGVPAKAEARVLNWRHNLGQGATARVLDAPDFARDPGTSVAWQLAHDAAQALGLRFGSVDVVLAGGKAQVLEVNSGVMMEFLARTLPDGLDIARRVYARALDAMFGPGPR